MRPTMIAGGALIGLLVAGALLVPIDPWGPLGALAALLCGVSTWLLMRGVRDPAAPGAVRPGPALVIAGMVVALAIGFVLLPGWGLVSSYLADPGRRELVATSATLVAALVILIFVTQEAGDA